MFLFYTTIVFCSISVPVCESIVHLVNGFPNCTNDDFRGSSCELVCNTGYLLNGTTTTECLDSGTWSYGDELPQCLRNDFFNLLEELLSLKPFNACMRLSRHLKYKSRFGQNA